MPNAVRMVFALFFMFFLTACSLMPNQTSDQIIKSNNDKREYRAFVLDNQLPVIVISDPAADKAAAAMNVSVGSGSDPEEFAGLAIFLCSHKGSYITGTAIPVDGGACKALY